MTSLSKRKAFLPSILVVDDIPEFCAQVCAFLDTLPVTTEAVLSPGKVLKQLRSSNVHLIITTLVMREMSGMDLIRMIRGTGSAVPILMVTGHGGPQSAVEALRVGANDYMEKPLSQEELTSRVNMLLRGRRVEGDKQARPFEFRDLLSEDPGMRSVFSMVRTIAKSDSRVLILGETGTGKHLIAKAIHGLSARRNHPFVEINCAAVPEPLLESELFGHERGAFTGATGRRIGRFEEAGEGTIFLDEIGEMEFDVQAKLLRVLNDGKFNRVGGQRTYTSKARVITATNRDLQAEAANGRFRADLFYRLHVIAITLPPLRNRSGDIPLLVDHFARRFSSKNSPAPVFTKEALQVMQRYEWPGNIRELEHLIERAAVLNAGGIVRVADLPETMRDAGGPPESLSGPHVGGPYKAARDRFERQYVETLLDLTHGNMSAAAKIAEMDRSQFFRMVRRLAITPRRITQSKPVP